MMLDLAVEKDKNLDVLLSRIGSGLRALRVEGGYTSYESFCYEHDLPRGHYWRLECGRANLTIKTLVKILAIHKLTLEDFMCSKLDSEANS